MYCYSCMNEIKTGEYCQHCMKDAHPDEISHHLRPGTLLNNRYIVGNAIGEGGFGITYIGLDTTLDIKVAVKEYFPSGYVNRSNTVSNNITITTQKQSEFFENGKVRFLQEARSIAKFSNENGVVDVRDHFEQNDTAYIVMEYLEGVTLMDKVDNDGVFDATELFALMIPIMKSLERMHNDGIVHRDISPDNIMFLENGTLKLMDFGSARYYTNEEKTMSVMLKQGFSPEEQYRKNGKQGPWTDVYGMCATIYKCITGVVPEDGLDRIHNDSLIKPSQLGINIIKPLEEILMYGLAVFRENRAQNMGELMSLTQKALKSEPLTIKPRTDTDTKNNIHKTMVADEMHRTRIADEVYENTQQQPISSDSYYRQPMPDFGTPPQVPRNKTNKTAIVIVAIAVCVMMMMCTFFAVMAFNGGFNSVSSNDKTTSSVTETGKDTEESTKESAKEVFEEPITTAQSVKPSPYDYSQKVTVSAKKGSSNARLKLLEWRNGDWTEIFSCSAVVGSQGISSNYGEGINATPLGTFKLGVVLTSTSFKTNMPIKYVDSDTCIVDDPSSKYYNTIKTISSLPSSVHYDSIGKTIKSGYSSACIFIEHNGNGYSSDNVVAGKGSVITICGMHASLSPTCGCIDISSGNMTKLLGLLDSSKNPYISTIIL